MSALKDCPRALFHKLLFTGLIGFGCLIIGVATSIYSRDTITLALSGLVFVFSVIRGFGLYRTIVKQKYEVIEGTCVGVSSKPFRKQLTVKIMDDAGLESSLGLGKQSKVKIGCRYRFYFKQGERHTVGSQYLDAALSSDCFLGFEELGERKAEN